MRFSSLKMSIIGVYSLCCGLFAGEALAKDEATILVNADEIACVIENIRAYRAVDTDPVLIIFSTCPNPELDGAAIAALAVTQKLQASGDSSAPAPALSLLQAELECLADPLKSSNLLSLASGGVIEWPENVCKL